MIGDVSEETIVDAIEEAASKTTFVIVDLEGTASLMVSYAISMSDFVIIPVQGSQLDAKQAARQMKLIKAQERIASRPIPYAVLFTRSNPAILPKTQRHIEERFLELSVPIVSARLYDREAFRAIFFVRRDLERAQRKRRGRPGGGYSQCAGIHGRSARSVAQRQSNSR